MPAQQLFQHKNLRVAGTQIAPTAPCEMSMWMLDGHPSGGAQPTTSWVNPTNTTAGSLMQTSPAAGLQQWLHAIDMQCPAGNAVRCALYDRLGHVSGLSGIVTTAQNVNGGSAGTVTRWSPNYTGLATNPSLTTGVGNEIFLEIYTSLGATAQTVTASYTNQAGTSGQTTQAVTLPSSGNNVQKIIRLPLAAGDTGVQAVTSVLLSGSTGTAGNFGLVIAHRMLDIVCCVGQPTLYAPTFTSGGPIEIPPGACLTWAVAYEITLSNTADVSHFDINYSTVDN